MSIQKSIEEIVEYILPLHETEYQWDVKDLKQLRTSIGTTLQSERDRAEEEKREAVKTERKRAAKIVESMMEDYEHWQPIAQKILTNTLTNPQDKQ